MVIQHICYKSVAPGATPSLATPFGSGTASSDSFTIMNSKEPAAIVDWISHSIGGGYHAILSESMHDQTQGYKVATRGSGTSSGSGLTQRLSIFGLPQQVEPQERLSVLLTGSATSGDNELGMITLAYPSLPSINPRLLTFADVQKMGLTTTTVQCTIAGSGAGYSGAELITADVDLMKANTDYALVGMSTTTEILGVYIQGPDTGNVKMIVPGFVDNRETVDYWAKLSRVLGEATIPVLNSGNRANTFVGVAANENAGNTAITLHLVELAK